MCWLLVPKPVDIASLSPLTFFQQKFHQWNLIEMPRAPPSPPAGRCTSVLSLETIGLGFPNKLSIEPIRLAIGTRIQSLDVTPHSLLIISYGRSRGRNGRCARGKACSSGSNDAAPGVAPAPHGAHRGEMGGDGTGEAGPVLRSPRSSLREGHRPEPENFPVPRA
jgi:hypothetical protein